MEVDEPVPDGGPTPDSGSADAVAQPSEAAAGSNPVGPEGELGDPTTPKRKSRRLVLSGTVIVVAVIVVAGVLLLVSNVSDALSTGTGTATITWTPATATGTPPNLGNLPQPFTGTIKGVGVSGANTFTLNSGPPVNPFAKTPTSTEIQAFRLKGTFGGRQFDLGVYFNLGNGPQTSVTALTVRGTYGTSAVNGSIGPPSTANLNNPSVPLDFHATIGGFKVSGLIYHNTGDAKKQTARATFTVTK